MTPSLGATRSGLARVAHSCEASPLMGIAKQRCGYASKTATISIDLGSTITI